MTRTATGITKLCRILLLTLLLLALAAGEASAGLSNVSAGSFSGEKMKVYVRAFVPGKKTPSKSIGHFDLMIQGKVTFRGKSFENPVFSYRREDSCLAVFSEANTGKYYSHSSPSDYYYDCDLYQGCFITVTSEKVMSFLNYLNKNIASVKKYSGGLKCKFKSSCKFSRYKVLSTNCFYAVAAWLEAFGEDCLMDYYKGAHSGKYSVYLPGTIVRAYSGKFRLRYAG